MCRKVKQFLKFSSRFLKLFYAQPDLSGSTPGGPEIVLLLSSFALKLTTIVTGPAAARAGRGTGIPWTIAGHFIGLRVWDGKIREKRGSLLCGGGKQTG